MMTYRTIDERQQLPALEAGSLREAKALSAQGYTRIEIESTTGPGATYIYRRTPRGLRWVNEDTYMGDTSDDGKDPAPEPHQTEPEMADQGRWNRWSGIYSHIAQPVEEGHDLESIWTCPDCSPNQEEDEDGNPVSFDWLESKTTKQAINCGEECHECGAYAGDDEEEEEEEDDREVECITERHPHAQVRKAEHAALTWDGTDNHKW